MGSLIGSEPLKPSEVEFALRSMLTRVNSVSIDEMDGFPHYAEPDGRWFASPDGDWTGGFWVGELWLSTALNGGRNRSAEQWMERLAARLKSRTIFRGFLFYYGAVLGSRLCDNDRAQALAVEAARQLETEFHPCGILGLGSDAEEASDVGEFETSIDAVGGITGLLSFAARVTGDAHLGDLAFSHARWHLTELVRRDGSVVQSATFDPLSGKVLRTYTHKGIAEDSTWARAQAWGLLAATEAAIWQPQHRAEFIVHAEAIADWWLSRVPTFGVPLWDFDAPNGQGHEIDTSAAAIVSACLLRLEALGSTKAASYGDAARSTVATLVRDHLTPLAHEGALPEGMLTGSCYNRRIGLATNTELIWGSYYLLESLNVLLGKLDPLLL